MPLFWLIGLIVGAIVVKKEILDKPKEGLPIIWGSLGPVQPRWPSGTAPAPAPTPKPAYPVYQQPFAPDTGIGPGTGTVVPPTPGGAGQRVVLGPEADSGTYPRCVQGSINFVVSPCPSGYARGGLPMAAIAEPPCGKTTTPYPLRGRTRCIPGGKSVDSYLTVNMPPVPEIMKLSATGDSGYHVGQTQSDMDVKVAALKAQCAAKNGYLISTSFGRTGVGLATRDPNYVQPSELYKFNCVPRTLVGVDFKKNPEALNFLSPEAQAQLRQFMASCPDGHTIQYNQCADFAPGYGLGKRCSFRCFPTSVSAAHTSRWGMQKNNPDAVLTPGVQTMQF